MCCEKYLCIENHGFFDFGETFRDAEHMLLIMNMCDIKLDCTNHNRTNTANTEICNEY